MEVSDQIFVSGIGAQKQPVPDTRYNSIILVKENLDGLLIDGHLNKTPPNTLVFLNYYHRWTVLDGMDVASAGYVLKVTDTIMNEPSFLDLQINKLRILYPDQVLCCPVEPEMEVRLQSILEMLGDLKEGHLKHKEDAILSLVNAFFVYLDVLCVVEEDKSKINGKAALVYHFLKLISDEITEIQQVSQYADKMHVSPAYLNECTQEIMDVNAKSLIIGQLVIRARNELRYSRKSAKEIAYELGFSSPDYFSSFCKKHLGKGPLEFRKA